MKVGKIYVTLLSPLYLKSSMHFFNYFLLISFNIICLMDSLIDDIYMISGLMKKTTKKLSSSNTFQMKGEPKTKYKQPIVIDFQPQKPCGFVHSSMKQLQKKQSLIPTFNLDVKIFTPTFCIPSIQINQEHYSQKFQQKLAQYQQIDLEDIIVPKPRNKDYCNVCESKFKDYLEHSYSVEHIAELTKNKFQKRIKKLCDKFQKKHNRINRAKRQQILEKYESCSESNPQEQIDIKNSLIQNCE